MTDQPLQPITPTAAVETLTHGHRGQHRCGPGRWFGVDAWRSCPTNVAAAALVDALAEERARVHEAAHDDTAVHAVLTGMTGFTVDDLAAMEVEDRDGWTLTARGAIEALAAHLDPTVP